jgi:hypothetical protein
VNGNVTAWQISFYVLLLCRHDPVAHDLARSCDILVQSKEQKIAPRLRLIIFLVSVFHSCDVGSFAGHVPFR